jgi:hypothetical protein
LLQSNPNSASILATTPLYRLLVPCKIDTAIPR